MTLHICGERGQGLFGGRGLLRLRFPFGRKALAQDHIDVADSLNDLGALYHAQGQDTVAEPLHKRALAIFEKALGPDHPNVGTSLNNLAALYQATERDTEAAILEQRAARIEAIQRCSLPLLDAPGTGAARAIPSCLRRGCPQVHRLDWRLAIEIGGFPDDAGFRL